MKIQQRFVLHLLLGFVIWLLLLAVTVPFVMEGILPKLGLGDESYEWFVMIIMGVDTVLCIIWFGWYFASPLLLIMKWIDQLANEDFSLFKEREKIYTRKQKLKMRFRLYQEVIRQLNHMQDQLQKAKVERTQLEKVKREWIAGISHDLKTPLTYIKGYSKLLLNTDYHWSKEEQRGFIQEIDDKGTHMEQLVQDLNLSMHFDGSQSVPIHKTTQNMISFVQQVLADISSDLRAQKHHFELQTEMNELAIKFDPQLLKRALQNIYMNAVIHNEAPVMITTIVEKKQDKLTISIQDNGIGMTEKTQQNLFNRYYRGTTTEQKSEGTGLGMAIVKSLIEAHEGVITVESELQKGTKFIVTLPFEKGY
ncbi:HAMP domain-containing sensor histidine kinase [Lysinibacillus sp. KU-BSD001]|uniref:sensor histidine kinase n=1 Tax=Lysinibacillus sp. KU-BSD001 TaxID=3141328 RepID=UPI0036E988A4